MRTVKVRNLELETGTPRICVPLVARDLAALREAAARACAAPCDLVEFRADFLDGLLPGDDQINEPLLLEALSLIRQLLGDMPLLFTFRTAAEGGEQAISSGAYCSLNLLAARSALTDLIDIEMLRDQEQAEKLVRELHETGIPVIGSNHHFEGTPPTEEITGALVRMQQLGADMTKIAVMPGSRSDVIRLLDASVQMYEGLADRPYVTMAMGALGMLSRAAGTLTGSAVTFAAAGAASAPGQMDAAVLRKILGFLS